MGRTAPVARPVASLSYSSGALPTDSPRLSRIAISSATVVSVGCDMGSRVGQFVYAIGRCARYVAVSYAIISSQARASHTSMAVPSARVR